MLAWRAVGLRRLKPHAGGYLTCHAAGEKGIGLSGKNLTYEGSRLFYQNP